MAQAERLILDIGSLMVDPVDRALAVYVISSILTRYREMTEIKYKRFERDRKPNEIFVHEILQYYFNFPKNEDGEVSPRMIIGDAIDSYIKSSLGSSEPVISVPYSYGGREFNITGKPDAIVPFGDRTYIVEIKYSDRIREYHILQVYLYGFLYKMKYGTDNIRGCIVLLKDRLDVKILSIDFDRARDLIEGYLRFISGEK